MGIRSIPFFKGKKGWQFAGGGQDDGSGGGGGGGTTPLANNAGYHNSIYRGISLGNTVTTAQYTSIKNGTFDDMYIGDYWTIDGVVYRIAGFDYWLNTGDEDHVCTDHHVLIVPDSVLDTKAMNDTAITSGGYKGSKMYTTYIPTIITTLESVFGQNHILTHREKLSNTVTSGNASAFAWVDSSVVIMNETMAYGSEVCSGRISGETNFNVGIDKTQLPLFRHDTTKLNIGVRWWLRSVVSNTHFATVYGTGTADYNNASNDCGIRPVFALYNPTV